MLRHSAYFWILFGLVACIGLGAYTGQKFGSDLIIFLHPHTAAADISTIEKCTQGTDAVACTLEPIQDLMHTKSPGEVIILIANTNLSPEQCHFLTHIVGQQIYKTYHSVELSLAQCNQMCGSACTHGVTGEAFMEEAGLDASKIDPEHLSAEDIRQVGKKLCSTHDTCHGVGHVLFQAYSSIDQALSGCAQVATGAKLEYCYAGVFMEYSDQLGSRSAWENSTTSPPQLEALSSFCNRSSLSEMRACFTYLPVIMEHSLMAAGEPATLENTLDHVQKICESASNLRNRTACILGVGSAYLRPILSDPTSAAKLCGRFQKISDRSTCVLGSVGLASIYKQTDKILTYCAAQPKGSIQDVCYQEAFVRVYQLGWSIEEAKTLCKEDVMCLSGAAKYQTNLYEAIFQ